MLGKTAAIIIVVKKHGDVRRASLSQLEQMDVKTRL